MQNHFNLIYREEEREMLPLCRDRKIAVTPHSPMAGGKLTRDLNVHTLRGDTDEIIKLKYGHSEEKDRIIIQRVAEIAEKRNIKKAQVALSWVLQKDGVTAPVIGAAKDYHIADAIDALKVVLSKEEVTYLEEAYVPHEVVGAQ